MCASFSACFEVAFERVLSMPKVFSIYAEDNVDTKHAGGNAVATAVEYQAPPPPAQRPNKPKRPQSANHASAVKTAKKKTRSNTEAETYNQVSRQV